VAFSEQLRSRKRKSFSTWSFPVERDIAVEEGGGGGGDVDMAVRRFLRSGDVNEAKANCSCKLAIATDDTEREEEKK
jgi:hypothetical protein